MFCGIALRFCTLAELGIYWAGILGVLGVQRAVLGSLPGGGTRALLWVTRQAGARGWSGGSSPACSRQEYPGVAEAGGIVTSPAGDTSPAGPQAGLSSLQCWAHPAVGSGTSGSQLCRGTTSVLLEGQRISFRRGEGLG